MVDLVTVPIGATTHAKAEVPGDFEELGALGGRLERMVCLKPAHSLAREGLDEVNDAIPCGWAMNGCPPASTIRRIASMVSGYTTST